MGQEKIHHTLIGPGSIPWEVGNAFSSMLKQGRLTLEEAHRGFAIFESIPLRYAKPDFVHTLTLAHQINMYAYDAYFLDCAIRHNAPLLTLDQKLKNDVPSIKAHISSQEIVDIIRGARERDRIR
jgi:predicted nucleic acid-binding protein